MSKKFHKEHKELMHYTNASGLYGIVTSKKLWASHTSFMNDAEEVVGFPNRVLHMILRQEFERYVGESEDFAADVQAAHKLGVDLIEIRVKKLVDTFKDAEKVQDHYVSSFCTTQDEWILRNGLLSQWRGYGLDGGYAIVFDAARLHSLLTAESAIYYEERLLLTDIQYDMENFPEVKDEQVSEHIKNVKTWAHTMLRTGSTNTENEKVAESCSVLSILCKHRGFEEEKEARIVVSEPSVKIGPDPSNESGKPCRKIRSYPRNGVPVPCVHLFEDQKLDALPIRRVIVGPHPEKSDRKSAVEILLRNHNINAEVLESDTPFRGK
jgi:hypothetical protein